MELRKALASFYYSTALCELRLMNKQFADETITYNSLLIKLGAPIALQDMCNEV